MSTSPVPPALSLPTDRPVLVTGATGYVAGQVVHALLAAGLTVHATVRDPSRAERLAPLRALAATLPGQLRFFAADLLDPESFDAAMAGCAVVFHIASPFVTDVRDAQTQLVDPARKGTVHVLSAANRCPSVERVVLTSSCAAIFGDSADLAHTPRGVFDESVWNTSSSLDHNPYSLSKTVAERAAWELAEAQDRWRLVVLNPAMVMGPGIHPHHSSESVNLLLQMGDGTLRMGAPDIHIGMVDVRDLAQAHLRAAFLPEAEGRHVIVGTNTSFPAMAQALLPRYGAHYPIPTGTLPKWLLWLVGPFVNAALTRRFVSRNVGLPWVADNRKSVEALGMRYRPLDETMTEMFQQMIDGGRLPDAGATAA